MTSATDQGRIDVPDEVQPDEIPVLIRLPEVATVPRPSTARQAATSAASLITPPCPAEPSDGDRDSRRPFGTGGPAWWTQFTSWLQGKTGRSVLTGAVVVAGLIAAGVMQRNSRSVSSEPPPEEPDALSIHRVMDVPVWSSKPAQARPDTVIGPPPSGDANRPPTYPRTTSQEPDALRRLKPATRVPAGQSPRFLTDGRNHEDAGSSLY